MSGGVFETFLGLVWDLSGKCLKSVSEVFGMCVGSV